MANEINGFDPQQALREAFGGSGKIEPQVILEDDAHKAGEGVQPTIVPTVINPDPAPPPVVTPPKQGELEIPLDFFPSEKPATPPVVTPPSVVEPQINEADIAKLPAGQQNAIKSLRTYADALKRQLEESKKAPVPADAVEVTQLKQQIDALTNEVEKFNLEKSPRFNARFDVPKNNIIDQVKEYMKAGGVDDAELIATAEKAVKLGIKERITFLSEECPDVANAIFPMLAQVDSIERQRQASLANAKQNREKDQQELSQRSTQVRDQHMTAALTSLAEDGSFLVKEIPGNEVWNKNVTQIKGTIAEVFKSNDPAIQSKAMAAGVLYPMMANLYQKERAARVEMAKQLAKYGKATPSIGGSVPAGSSNGGVGFKPMSPDEAAAAMVAKFNMQ